MSNFVDPLEPSNVTVVTSDLLVATADLVDPLLHSSVLHALQSLRAILRVNAVFVAEVVERRKVTRLVDQDGVFTLAIGDAVPLEETYCRLVLDGQLPEYIPDVQRLAETLPIDFLPVAPNPAGIAAHFSTPILWPDGRVYGTLCCIGSHPVHGDETKVLQQLRQCAQFVAKAISSGQS
jgi:GAF domain-containing protein